MMKTKILTWFLNNWLKIAIIVLVIVLFRWGKNEKWGYKFEIDALNDSITNVIKERDAAEKRIEFADEIIKQKDAEIEAWRIGYEEERNKRIIDKRNHERKIADIMAVPIDTLYWDVARQLDSLSVLWR